jgi:predicted transcriptional regulator/transcriptional regulator with XRE-family HTH domain
MAETAMLGAKVRSLRQRKNMTQAQLADRMGVSASYLNLIENNRRPLTANLLLKLAEEFQLDLGAFSSGDDARLVADLSEVFSDPMFDGRAIAGRDMRELATSTPELARAVLKLYRGYRDARASAATFAEQLALHGGAEARIAANPTEEVNELLQRHGNYFPEIEAAAEALWRDAGLDSDEVYGGLIGYLKREHGIEVRVSRAEEGSAMRRYEKKRKLITLSEVLPPRTRRFQLAHQVGLITQRELFDNLRADEQLSDEVKSLARVVQANYFAAAVLMPYEPFLQAAKDVRYDVELLAHRYGTSFEQVCHRLTTMRRPGSEGIPLHFLRIDIAGNISKRFSASGIRMPRFSGACPRWCVHAAFLTPGMIRVQLSRMFDGTMYFCLARTVQRATGGYQIPHTVHSICIGCEARYARQMVYADGIDIEHFEAATPVGVSCRTCEQMDCEQRVFPPMQHPLSIDENVRGVSFYAPVPLEATHSGGGRRG